MVDRLSIIGWACLLYAPFLGLSWLFVCQAPQLLVVALLVAFAHCALWLLFGFFFRLLTRLVLGSASAAAVAAADGDSSASVFAAVLTVVVYAVLQSLLRVGCVLFLLWVQTQLRRMRQVLLYSRFRWVGVSLAVGLGEALVAVTTSGGAAVEQAFYNTYYQEGNATAPLYNGKACPQLPVFVHSAAQSLLYTLLVLASGVLCGQSLAAFFNAHPGHEEAEDEAEGGEGAAAVPQEAETPRALFLRRCCLMWVSICAVSAASPWHHGDPLELDVLPMMQPVTMAEVEEEEEEGEEGKKIPEVRKEEDRAAAYRQEGATHTALRDTLPPRFTTSVTPPAAAADVRTEDDPGGAGGRGSSAHAAAPPPMWVPSETALIFYLPFARLSLLVSLAAPLLFRLLPALLHHGAGVAQPDGSTAARSMLGCVATLPLQLVLAVFLLLWSLWIVRVEYTKLQD